jgi:serine/threonine-protein kinase
MQVIIPRMLKHGTIVGGKYRLLHIVGEGGMASVWSAVHDRLGRPVAVKFIHAGGDRSPVATARFIQEARAAAGVQHRYVIDIFDFGETEAGEPYMVMELLHGESLADRAASEDPLPVTTFLSLMEMTLSGLSAAHQSGIIHRDLKPENIFLVHEQEDFFPKIVDFGISRIRQSGLLEPDKARLTQEGNLVGTPNYMSPEQIRALPSLDHRTDIYSMGVIMYEFLTGQLPFSAPSVGQLIVKIATEDAVPADVLRPELGEDLSNLVRKAMSRRPEERFPDAAAMRRALRALAVEQPGLNTAVLGRNDGDGVVEVSLSDLESAEELQKQAGDHQPDGSSEPRISPPPLQSTARARPGASAPAMSPHVDHAVKGPTTPPKAVLAGLLVLALVAGVGTGLYFGYSGEPSIDQGNPATGEIVANGPHGSTSVSGAAPAGTGPGTADEPDAGVDGGSDPSQPGAPLRTVVDAAPAPATPPRRPRARRAKRPATRKRPSQKRTGAKRNTPPQRPHKGPQFYQDPGF